MASSRLPPRRDLAGLKVYPLARSLLQLSALFGERILHPE